jgi:hypothetical protein
MVSGTAIFLNMKELNIEAILGDKYPHASFHDAVIETINIDYLKREVVLQCVLYVGNPDDDVIPREAKGQLTLTGLLYLAIEPPDEKYSYDEDGLDISYDGPVATTPFKSPIPTLPQDIPENAFVHCFYINNHNRFLFLAASGAHYSWN